MGILGYYALALSGIVGLSHAASADQWATRSIYQVVTDRFARPSGTSGPCNITKYCGGSWAGLVDKLDYIQDMGFTAVQISPITKNLEQDTIYGEAFHGYWPQDLYALNSHFGTPDDLKSLSEALHKRGMYLMVDVVANEMAYDIGNNTMSADTKIDYSVFHPFNSSSDYMPYCPLKNWNNETEYTHCWLGYQGVATPRIKTTDPAVNNTLNQWIKDLVGTYKIDGIRIDGAKQIERSFLKPFIESSGVFAMAEVDQGDPGFVCGYQDATGGLENYALYYTILRAFTAGQMDQMVSMIKSVQSACSSPQYLATFIENQDNPRFASTDDDITLAQNAIAFTILADGIPKIYYGQEQHLPGNYSPYNRQQFWDTEYDTSAPLYKLTATLNKLRNHAISLDNRYVTQASEILYHDPSTYVSRKGPNGVQVVAVLSNQGSNGGAYQLPVHEAADPGTNLTEVMECTTVVAGGNGTIVVDMDKGQPRVFFPTFQMNGTGLCGHEEEKGTGTGTKGDDKAGAETGTSATATSTNEGAAGRVSVPVGLMGLVLLGMFL